MLVIQGIAIAQGIFILILLYAKRNEFKRVSFWLLFGSIVSMLLYLIGDGENNLISIGSDWFFIDSYLFITFLFLFFKYKFEGIEKFNIRDYLYFVPNIVFFIIEFIEVRLNEQPVPLEVAEFFVELIFCFYLIRIITKSWELQQTNWLLSFSVPILLILLTSWVHNLLVAFRVEYFGEVWASNVNTGLVLISAFLFYFLAFKLLLNSADIIPKLARKKYEGSTLSYDTAMKCESELVRLMEEEKLFLDSKLTLGQVSEILDTPRQYISEVLSHHMNTNFQNFVNGYRVNEFLKRLKDDQNDRFTLLSLALESGFNSKSSFNSIFKKFKGLTPTQYKLSLQRTDEQRAK
ncbi:MAG: helix-turn-helix domain-containing protein [Cryomorphaceae bacterium]